MFGLAVSLTESQCVHVILAKDTLKFTKIIVILSNSPWLLTFIKATKIIDIRSNTFYINKDYL